MAARRCYAVCMCPDCITTKRHPNRVPVHLRHPMNLASSKLRWDVNSRAKCPACGAVWRNAPVSLVKEGRRAVK